LSGALALTAATRNAGSYAINQGTVAVSDGNGGNNYILSVDPSITYLVTPALLTITAQTDSRAYNGTTSSTAVPLVVGALYGSDNLSGLLQVYEDKNVGTGKTLNVAGYTVNDGNSGNNYSVTTATDNTGSIHKADLAVTANNTNKTYGQTTTFAGTEFTPAGLVNNETIGSVTLASAGAVSTASVAGSPYSIVPSNATGGTFDAGNYTITYANGSLAVSPAALTVTANNDSKTYNGLAYTGGNGVSYSGFVSGEDASVLAGSLGYGGDSQGATAVGAYKITPYGLSSSNYSIIFADGSLYVRDSVSSLRDQVVPVQVALTVPTSWDGKVGSESSASGPAVSLGAAGTQVFVSGDGGVQLSAYSRHIFIRNGGVRQ
jgi:hypothetical protein